MKSTATGDNLVDKKIFWDLSEIDPGHVNYSRHLAMNPGEKSHSSSTVEFIKFVSRSECLEPNDRVDAANFICDLESHLTILTIDSMATGQSATWELVSDKPINDTTFSILLWLLSIYLMHLQYFCESKHWTTTNSRKCDSETMFHTVNGPCSICCISIYVYLYIDMTFRPECVHIVSENARKCHWWCVDRRWMSFPVKLF